jgi:phage N-6-adenine-methyltransferase
MSTMPAQKPGRSVQEVGTPREFLDAVEKRFGRIAVDLAANADNHVCEMFVSPEDDSLSWVWESFLGNLWLNPPYANIGDWAKKAAQSAPARVLMLIPAAVGTNYFREWIYPYAQVYALSPRLTFAGHTQSYPKDLILCDYRRPQGPGFECWRWDGK